MFSAIRCDEDAVVVVVVVVVVLVVVVVVVVVGAGIWRYRLMAGERLYSCELVCVV